MDEQKKKKRKQKTKNKKQKQKQKASIIQALLRLCFALEPFFFACRLFLAGAFHLEFLHLIGGSSQPMYRLESLGFHYDDMKHELIKHVFHFVYMLNLGTPVVSYNSRQIQMQLLLSAFHLMRILFTLPSVTSAIERPFVRKRKRSTLQALVSINGFSSSFGSDRSGYSWSNIWPCDPANAETNGSFHNRSDTKWSYNMQSHVRAWIRIHRDS